MALGEGIYKMLGLNPPKKKSSGSESSNGGSNNDKSTLPAETPQAGMYIAGRGFVTNTGRTFPTTNPNWVPEGYAVVGSSSNITTGKGGGVISGGTTYYGKAIVPNTGGKTANQIRADVVSTAGAYNDLSPSQMNRIMNQTSLPTGYTTTADTGTGYNPATGSNVPEPQVMQSPNLKTSQGVATFSYEDYPELKNVMGTVDKSLLNQSPYSSGTESYQQIDFKQKTEVSNFQDLNNMFNAVLIAPALSGSNVENMPLSGDTGGSMADEFHQRRDEIVKDLESNPLTYFKNVKASYNLQKEFQVRSNKIADAYANIPVTYGATDELRQNAIMKNLFDVGVVPTDIKTISTTITTPEGYIQTTRTLDLGMTFGSGEIGVTRSIVEHEGKAMGYLNLVAGDLAKVGKVLSVAKIMNSIGLVGGASTEGGAIGRGFTSISSEFPVVGRALEWGAKPSVQLTLVGATGVETGTGLFSSSVKTIVTGEKFELGGGYKMGKDTGLNPYATAVLGFGTGVSQYYAFTAGATGGEISPIKAGKFQVMDAQGNMKTVQTLSVGEPFTGKYIAIGTRFEGQGFYAGYAPQSAFKGFTIPQTVENQYFFGTSQGVSEIKHFAGKADEWKNVYNTVSQLRMQNTGEPNIDLSNQKAWADMRPAEQLEYTKQMQQLGSDVSSTGFRRFTGSITGYYNRPAGDVDIVLGTYGSPYDKGFQLSEIMGRGWSVNSAGQVFRGNVKMAEFLIPENAIPQPMGFFPRQPISATISGSSVLGSTQTTATKAGQSLTELGSAVTFPQINPSTGQWIIGVNVDKPQRIVDFYTTGKLLGGSETKSLEAFKVTYTKLYPSLNWESGNVVSTVGATGTSTSLVSSSSSAAIAAFLPKGASSTSTNTRAFLPVISRSSAISISSVSAVPKSSYSSFSSIVSSISSSSSSSSSSRSSVSSISSSVSPPSFSSSSSSSSSSSFSSSSSSSSSFTGGVPFIPPIVLPFGGDFDFKSFAKIFRGKRSYRYTPSFEALIFNIRGKIPKGVETGARVRPIPKGFSWFTSKFKVPSFKLPSRKRRKRK